MDETTRDNVIDLMNENTRLKQENESLRDFIKRDWPYEAGPLEVVAESDAEIKRLRDELADAREARADWIARWRNTKEEIEKLREELAREKKEHDRCTTFHAIAVKERDYERRLVQRRDAEIERLQKELAEKEDYIRTISRPVGAHSYE